MNLIYLGLIGAAVVIYLSSLNWRRSVKIVLLLLVLEGAIRKWALPQASQLLYFLKDFVLIGAYISYFSRPKSKRRVVIKAEAITILIYMSGAWCLFQAFNPSLGSPIIGLFGIKNYFLYIPLMWVLPYLFPSEEEFYKFLRSYLLLLIPVGMLAIAQYFSPPDSPLNVYARDEVAVAVAGQAVRVTGTFSYLTGYTVYLASCFCWLLPLLTMEQPLFWQWLTIAEVLLVAITSFMTGSRGIMITLVLMLVGYLGLQGTTQFSKLLRSVQKLLIPSIIGFNIVVSKFQAAIDSFWVRTSSNNDVLPRIISSFTEPFAFFV
ncbi:hypothetical protein, partial [Moorena sp. SIO3I6]|uniref:hypothetical protein n=1 Tax=Moorena sp. SIO3I6 TaxID=2607831 RepID=UPI0013F8090E